MELKLFVEDLKGYIDTYTDVKKIKIEKKEKKNVLKIEYWLSTKEDEIIPLNEIRLAFMVDLNTMIEMFRYEK